MDCKVLFNQERIPYQSGAIYHLFTRGHNVYCTWDLAVVQVQELDIPCSRATCRAEYIFTYTSIPKNRERTSGKFTMGPLREDQMIRSREWFEPWSRGGIGLRKAGIDSHYRLNRQINQQVLF